MSVPSKRVAIVGGGAAGFFAAITCAEAAPDHEISIYERGSQFLTKVRISGGGRCNVTHACFDERDFTEQYPRGNRALIPPLHRFSATDTIEWFQARGVKLKTESDGRMFPVTDSSETVVDCLTEQARKMGIRLFARHGIDRIRAIANGGFELQRGEETIRCDRLLLALGGCRSAGSGELVRSVGHKIIPPVPSLFSFHTAGEWLRSLPGIAVTNVEVAVPDTNLKETGPLLITHDGVSGPVILRLSAWGARILHGLNYEFRIRIQWLPHLNEETFRDWLKAQRVNYPGRLVINTSPPSLPARLWEQVALTAGIPAGTRWAQVTRPQTNKVVSGTMRTELTVHGKSLNKDEFVTCGGVDLREVDFRTMQSRLVPNLYFAGELLDIDGITGGFNFQAAWTTGWIAGRAMAGTNENKA